MREALALVRASWLHALSYRLQMVFAIGGLIVSIVPLYFVSRALQPVMAASIRNEGQEYFAFLIVGLVTYACINTAVNGLHGAVSADISTGAFEALLATPTSMVAILAGMLGQPFMWTLIRALLLLVGAWLLGAQVAWSHSLVAAGVLSLTVLSYIPFGVMSAALVLAFRTTGPFPAGIMAASVLLGGVYYPTTVIPSWLSSAADFVPLGYGLRALRRSLIDGQPVSALAGDVAILAAFTVVLMAASVLAFSLAVQHAKRAGTLAQY